MDKTPIEAAIDVSQIILSTILRKNSLGINGINMSPETKKTQISLITKGIQDQIEKERNK